MRFSLDESRRGGGLKLLRRIQRSNHPGASRHPSLSKEGREKLIDLRKIVCLIDNCFLG